MSLFGSIFNNLDSESYLEAKKSLSRIKERISDFEDIYPNISRCDLKYIKYKWVDLPLTIGVGVSVMGLGGDDFFTSNLTRFKESGYLLPHEHKNSFEHNKVIKGEVINKVNGYTYKEGDTFTINNNEKHHLFANKESEIFCVLSDNLDYLPLALIDYRFLSVFTY